ncbi:VTT domain-containing protein [Chloroflexota bacterium]
MVNSSGLPKYNKERLLEVPQIEQERLKKGWHFYLISSLSFLLTLAIAGAIIYFWEEIQQAQGYCYAGGFVVSVLGGVTVIPAPSLVVTFTLGRVLNPIYVGLVSGFGEALGGLTIYLTGAGVETVWSKLRSREQTFERRLGLDYDSRQQVKSQLWSKGEAFYNRLVKWVGGKGGSGIVFITAAMPLSPFYFAGLAAGSLHMGLTRFFLLSWMGKTVKGMIVAFAGYWGLYFLLEWIGG